MELSHYRLALEENSVEIGVVVIGHFPVVHCSRFRVDCGLECQMPSSRLKDRAAKKKNICVVLRGHMGQRTVLGVALPVLSSHIDALRSGQELKGLTEKQIESSFRELNSKFGKSDYHSTYLHRGLARFLEGSGPRYKIRAPLLAGVTVTELALLRDELLESLRSAHEKRQAVIRTLVETCALPVERIEERHALVDSYLSQLTGNRGEMFEVVSFAVLREYFRTFGFSLQRFSTTHANDGGMDFVGGEAIYQVTTDESVQKVRRDLAKAPGTKRVLVRPTTTPAIDDLCHEDVLETVELKDLLNHFISWLLARDTRSQRARHLQSILQTALAEFRRENRAESAELDAVVADVDGGGEHVALPKM